MELAQRLFTGRCSSLFKRALVVSVISAVTLTFTPAWSQIDTFSPDDGTIIDLLGDSTTEIVTGDMDADGDDDIVALLQAPEESFSGLRVLLNDGQGGLSVASQLDGFFGQLALGDFDGNGFLDVASFTSAGSTASIVRLALNQGDGILLPAVNVLDLGFDVFRAFDILAIDSNGDGDTDLIISYEEPDFDFFDPLDPFAIRTIRTTATLENDGVDGSGNVFFSVDQSIEGIAGSLDSADVNDDGFNDVLVVCNTSDCDLTRLLLNSGSGDGRFNFDEHRFAESMSVGVGVLEDINGDGRLDVALSVGGLAPIPTVLLYLNNGQAGFGEVTDFFSDPDTQVLAFRLGALNFADLDSDGDSDLVLVNDASVDLFENNGGQFQLPIETVITPPGVFPIFPDGLTRWDRLSLTTVSQFDAVTPIGILDLNGDQLLDIIIGTGTGGVRFLNNSSDAGDESDSPGPEVDTDGDGIAE